MKENLKILIKEQSDEGVLRLIMNNLDQKNALSENIKAAVATGENLNNVGDFYALISNQAADILNVSTYQSGVTGLKQISNIAYAFELPVTTMNCIGNYNAQIASTIPNHVMMEVVDPGREQAYSKWNDNIEDGFLHLDNTPGLGLIVDENKLKKLQSAKTVSYTHLTLPTILLV